MVFNYGMIICMKYEGSVNDKFYPYSTHAIGTIKEKEIKWKKTGSILLPNVRE